MKIIPELVWTTRTVSIKDLKPAEYNPRDIGDEELELLSHSLADFGLVEDIAVNTDMTVIGGHQRIKAAQKLGWSEIEVRVPNRLLSEDECKDLNIRLNSPGLQGFFNDDKLKVLVKDLEPRIDIERLGLGKRIDKLMKNLHNNPDVIPDPPPEPKSKLGDIYLLGDHRVMCGDSTKTEDVEKLMDGRKADMVFTDPPYGVSYADKNKYLNAISPGNRIQTEIKGDHKPIEELKKDVILPAFKNIKEILNEKASYYITAPQGGDLLMMMMMMQESGLTLRHMIIWVKNNHVLGRTDYNYKHEPILYGWINTHNFYGNGQHRFSTWEINKPHKSDLHPTMKPVELIVNAIKNSSQRDNIIIDLFLGSGSTLIACEQTQRTCYGMEIDPRYVDVIIQRWENLTDGKATKVEPTAATPEQANDTPK